jgi:hypothetical protein
VRSATIWNNDFGWRGFLVAQFVLLLWGVRALERWRGKLPWGIAILLVAGVAGTVYQYAMNRSYFPLTDSRIVGLDVNTYPHLEMGNRAFAMRALYEELRNRIPLEAVVQNNPDQLPYDYFYGLYGRRQTADGAVRCGTYTGGDVKKCAAADPEIAGLFARAGRADVDEVCGRWGIDVVIVKDVDPVWSEPGSWVWRRKAMVQNRFGRAFQCGRY